MSSRAKSQEERLGGAQSSPAWGLITSRHLKDSATTESQSSHDMPGKGHGLAGSYIQEITTNILKYLSVSMKEKEQGDSLNSQSPPPSTVQTQEAVTRKTLFCTMAPEVQSIMDAVVQTLVNWLDLNVEDPPKVQRCNMEPLISQLGGSSRYPESCNDTKSSRPERTSYDHTSPQGHNNPFLYWRTRDKQQSGVGTQKAGDPR